MLYERLCQLGERIPPFSIIAERRSNRDLEKALNFLKPLMKLNQEAVYSTAYLFAFLMFILGLIATLVLNLFIVSEQPDLKSHTLMDENDAGF